MLARLTTALANTGLLLVAVTILAAPLLLGQLLSSYQAGTLGESTQAPSSTTSTAAALFTTQTNPDQFAPYIEFDPQPVITSNSYQTSVTFTSFTKQQAAYNGLLTLTNTSDHTLIMQAEVGTLSGLADNSKVWLSLASDTLVASTLTTKAAAAGATSIPVASASGFNSGTVVLGDQIVSATAANQNSLTLTKPLAVALPVGQKVYFGPAYFANQAKPNLADTRSVSLLPGQSINLNLVVATEKGDLDTNQLVLPLIVTAK